MPTYSIGKQRMESSKQEQKLRLRFDDIRQNHLDVINPNIMASSVKYNYEEIVNG